MQKLSALVIVVVTVVLPVATAGCPGRDPHNVDGDVDGEGEGEGEGDVLPPECAEDTNHPVTPGAGTIYFGTRAPTLAPLSAAQINAIVSISDVNTQGAFCSGTLISPTVVLTAVHCTTDDFPSQLRVLFGENDLEPILTLNVTAKHETDADTDVAVLELEHAPSDDIEIVPIPINTEPPTADIVGVLVENSGFGENEDGGYSGRFFVTERLDGFDDKFIQVNGEGTRGVCFGDSGGPSLFITPQGDVRTLGALSFGDSACMNVDNYGRADAIKDFIEAVTGPTPTAVPEACGAVTAAGSCNVEQALATFCDESGNLVHDLCDPGQTCRDDGNGNARCQETSGTACGTLTSFGSCDAATGVLSWCDDGALKTRDCTACGERCLLTAPAEGFTCVASDCGNLDRIGQCDGDVSEWCDASGTKVSEDCGAEGTTCEFLGDVLGFYCLDQDACEGLNYQGECDGDTLRWCEDNELQEADCTADGGTCVHVDDETGFDCSK